MKAQFKYSIRAHLPLRAIAISAVLVMNLVFGFLGYYNIYGQGGKITAVTLCSIALCGLLVICIITDFDLLRGMCSAPAGYLTALTPVKSWKIMLSRVITILVEDMISLVIAISGVVLQSFILNGFINVIKTVSSYPNSQQGPEYAIWSYIIVILAYLQLILIILFGIVLSKSLFYNFRAGTFLAVLATVAAAYALNLFDFILMPFGVIENWGIFYSINLVAGPNAGFFAYILLSLCKPAALFLASSYLMERKINI